jgi:hypothetical protein
VTLPLCAEHLHHWQWRTQTLLITFLVLVLLIGLSVLIAMDGSINGDIGELTGPCCAMAAFGWIMQAVILRMTSIRAISITENTIVLSGISPLFLEAMHEECGDGLTDLDRMVREHWQDGQRREQPDDRYHGKGETDPRLRPGDR